MIAGIGVAAYAIGAMLLNQQLGLYPLYNTQERKIYTRKKAKLRKRFLSQNRAKIYLDMVKAVRTVEGAAENIQDLTAYTFSLRSDGTLFAKKRDDFANRVAAYTASLTPKEKEILQSRFKFYGKV
jgi:hypothetical protein